MDNFFIQNIETNGADTVFIGRILVFTTHTTLLGGAARLGLPCVWLLCGACTNIETLRPDSWTTGSEDHCVAVTLGWHVESDLLREIVGPNFEPLPSDDNGHGWLMLGLVSCQDSQVNGSGTGRFTASHVIVPLEPSRSPRLISGLSERGFMSLPLVIAESGSPTMVLFSNQGFTTVHGSTRLEIDRDKRSVSGEIRFSDGSIALKSSFLPQVTHTEKNVASVGTDGSLFNAVSGTVDSTDYWLSNVGVSINGNTPLSDLELSPSPPYVQVHQNVAWNVTFWADYLELPDLGAVD